jgi:hypothetical protein
MSYSSNIILTQNAPKLVNDMIVVLLDFHSNIMSAVSEYFIYFALVGVTLAAIGVMSKLFKQEDYTKQIALIIFTGIFLWPYTVVKGDFKTTFDSTMADRYINETYTVALGPLAIQQVFDSIYTILSGILSVGLTGSTEESNFSAMNSLQAISLSNSSVGYLMERTPLFSTLISYNAMCSPAASIVNNKLESFGKQPLSHGELLALGLYGGANFVGRAAYEDAYIGQDKYLLGLGPNKKMSNWPYNANETLERPSDANIDALKYFPTYQKDLVEGGILVLTESYWERAAAQWLSSITNYPNLSYQGLKDADVLKSLKISGYEEQEGIRYGEPDISLGAGFVMSDIAITRNAAYGTNVRGSLQHFDRTEHGTQASNRFYPGNCKEFYEIAHLSYLNFFKGLGGSIALSDYYNDGADHILLEVSLNSAASSALSRIVNLKMPVVNENDPNSVIKSDGGGFLWFAKEVTTELFTWFEGFFKALDTIISGAVLTSTITVGLAILFVISPFWFLIQAAIPGGQSAMVGYTRFVAMLYVVMFFIMAGSLISEMLAGMVLQTQALNRTEIDVFLTDTINQLDFDTGGPEEGKGIGTASQDPLTSQAYALNSLDSMIVGLHFANLMILGFASYAGFLVVQGADKGIKAVGTSISHAAKVAAGATLLLAKTSLGAAGKVASLKPPSGGDVAPKQPSSGGGGGMSWGTNEAIFGGMYSQTALTGSSPKNPMKELNAPPSYKGKGA